MCRGVQLSMIIGGEGDGVGVGGGGGSGVGVGVVGGG